MNANFAMSSLMIGSVIPGVRIPVQTKLANYQDFSREKLITDRKTVDPIIKFPDMNQQHGNGNNILEKLKQLMAGGGAHHPHGSGQMGKIPTREGYQTIKENLDWRKM